MDTEKADGAIASCSIQDANDLFERVKHAIIEKGAEVSPTELTVMQVTDLQKSVLPQKYSDQEVLYISPRETTYDYIICTDDISPTQAAKKALHNIGHVLP